MKLRKLFLGVAIVALMAACGGKTETTTETVAEAPVVETPVEEATEAPAEEPVAEVKNEAKPVKQEDPCEAKVKKFEQFVDKLQAAQKNKTNGAAALKEFAALVKAADAEQAAVKECISNVDYKTRVQNAMMRCKTSLK